MTQLSWAAAWSLLSSLELSLSTLATRAGLPFYIGNPIDPDSVRDLASRLDEVADLLEEPLP